MKVLVNKNNPAIKITAPEIYRDGDCIVFGTLLNGNDWEFEESKTRTLVHKDFPNFQITVPIEMLEEDECDYRIITPKVWNDLLKRDWTLVEKEQKQPEVDLEKKYIDSEKLYKQVDERMAHFAELEKETKPDDEDLSIFYQGKVKMCSELLDIINSLQQEKLEGWNKADCVKEIPFSLIYEEFAEHWRLGKAVEPGDYYIPISRLRWGIKGNLEELPSNVDLDLVKKIISTYKFIVHREEEAAIDWYMDDDNTGIPYKEMMPEEIYKEVYKLIKNKL